MLTILQLLAEVSEKTRVPILLIGGQALQAYGVVRQTLDVDVLIAEGDAGVLDEALRQAGYGVVVRSEIFARYRHPSAILADVDVLYVDGRTAEKLQQQATAHRMGGAPCRVPVLSHLVALKLHVIRYNPSRRRAGAARSACPRSRNLTYSPHSPVGMDRGGRLAVSPEIHLSSPPR